MRTHILSLAAFGLLFASQAFASECFSPVDGRKVQEATAIFLFRVTRLESTMQRKGDIQYVDMPRGKYEVEEVIKGSPPSVSEFRYVNVLPCAIRFDIDGYYVAFLSNSDRENFVATSTVLYLGTFDDVRADAARIRKAIADVEASADFDKAFAFIDMEHMKGLPSPPPPPCPNKADKRSKKQQ